MDWADRAIDGGTAGTRIGYKEITKSLSVDDSCGYLHCSLGQTGAFSLYASDVDIY